MFLGVKWNTLIRSRKIRGSGAKKSMNCIQVWDNYLTQILKFYKAKPSLTSNLMNPFTFSKSWRGVMLSGGLGNPRARSIFFSSPAVGDSCEVYSRVGTFIQYRHFQLGIVGNITQQIESVGNIYVFKPDIRLLWYPAQYPAGYPVSFSGYPVAVYTQLQILGTTTTIFLHKKLRKLK